MLGLKLFLGDTSPTLASEIINRAVRDRLGLEILLADTKGVHPTSERLDQLMAETSLALIPNKLLHLDPHKSQACKMAETGTRERLLSDIGDMRRLGIDKAVMHYHHGLPLSRRDSVSMRRNLEPISVLAEEHGVTFYIENTYFGRDPADPEFYQRMFEQVVTHKLGNLGFCFDLGHAKAHSDKPLRDWIRLLDWMRDRKIPLHLHLHNNDEVDDLHLSFMEAERQGLNEGDWFTSGIHYLVVVSELLARYHGVKILEDRAPAALSGLDWLQEQLRWRNSASF